MQPLVYFPPTLNFLGCLYALEKNLNDLTQDCALHCPRARHRLALSLCSLEDYSSSWSLRSHSFVKTPQPFWALSLSLLLQSSSFQYWFSSHPPWPSISQVGFVWPRSAWISSEALERSQISAWPSFPSACWNSQWHWPSSTKRAGLQLSSRVSLTLPPPWDRLSGSPSLWSTSQLMSNPAAHWTQISVIVAAADSSL